MSIEKLKIKAKRIKTFIFTHPWVIGVATSLVLVGIMILPFPMRGWVDATGTHVTGDPSSWVGPVRYGMYWKPGFRWSWTGLVLIVANLVVSVLAAVSGRRRKRDGDSGAVKPSRPL